MGIAQRMRITRNTINKYYQRIKPGMSKQPNTLRHLPVINKTSFTFIKSCLEEVEVENLLKQGIQQKGEEYGLQGGESTVR